MKAEYLHLMPDVENARICKMCIEENNIQFNNFQNIKDIFDVSSQRELSSYPVLSDSQLSEISQTISDGMDSETAQMDIYFQELTKEI